MKHCALLWLVACGSSSSSTPDSPVATHDASPDVAIDGATSGIANVKVVNGGVPISGAQVVFSTPTGAVSGTSVTGATGETSGNIMAGGSITAVIVGGSPPNAGHTLLTAFGVQPGDSLTLGAAVGNPGMGANMGNVHITYASAVANATSYVVDVGCNAANNPTSAAVTLAVFGGCLSSGGTFDVIASATDVNGNLLGYTVASGLTPPGSGNTLNQTMPSWRTDVASATLTITHAPATATLTGLAQIYDDPVEFANFAATHATVDASGNATIVPAWAKSVGNAVTWTMQVPYPSSVSGTPIKLYSQRTTTLASSTQTIDVSQMPALTSRTVEVESGRTTPTVTWASTAPLSSAQGVLASVSWAVSGVGSFGWLAAAPATMTKLQLPEMPDALADERVTSTQAFTQEQVLAVQSDLFPDFASFRATWGNALIPPARNYTLQLSAVQ